MNRKIKFRVWSKKVNHFIIPWTGKNYDDVDLTYGTVHGGSPRWFITGGDELDENYVMQQYTGLKDKNGKEIYEGDIIKTTIGNDILGQVVFSDGAISVRNKAGCDYLLCHVHERKTKVIGNVFENPELMK